MLLESQSQFDAWLEANHWLHDASVVSISPLPDDSSVPDVVHLAVRYQIAGGYSAGDERTVRTIQLVANGLLVFTLVPPGDWHPDHCSQEIESVNVPMGVGFEIDVPGVLTVVASHIEIASITDVVELVPQWLDDREFHVTSSNRIPPSPADWLELFSRGGRDAVWRYYAGDERAPSRVPADAYSGWFIQYRDRLRDKTGGLLFDYCGANADGYSITLRLDDAECRDLWIAAGQYLSRIENIVIHCGNAELSPDAFRTHLESTSSAEPGDT